MAFAIYIYGKIKKKVCIVSSVYGGKIIGMDHVNEVKSPNCTNKPFAIILTVMASICPIKELNTIIMKEKAASGISNFLLFS